MDFEYEMSRYNTRTDEVVVKEVCDELLGGCLTLEIACDLSMIEIERFEAMLEGNSQFRLKVKNAIATRNAGLQKMLGVRAIDGLQDKITKPLSTGDLWIVRRALHCCGILDPEWVALEKAGNEAEAGMQIRLQGGVFKEGDENKEIEIIEDDVIDIEGKVI